METEPEHTKEGTTHMAIADESGSRNKFAEIKARGKPEPRRQGLVMTPGAPK